MANQPQQQPQPQAGQQQPQQQQQAHQQAASALQQYGAAHGLHIDWSALLPIFIQLVQALTQGGGVQPQAQAGQPKTP